MEPAAFYLPAGDDRFESTRATAGPWSADSQHGGPPSALLARAFERLAPDPDQRLARLTVEILRPVPVRSVTVGARVVRPGRRVTLLEGWLRVDGEDYLLARAWRIARPPTPTPARGERAGSPPLPETALRPEWEGAFTGGYLRAIELRQTAGVFAGAGPGGAWFRARVPLVAGEEPSPHGLDGHHPVDGRVERFVDAPHGPLPDLSEDTVLADPLELHAASRTTRGGLLPTAPGPLGFSK